MKTKRLKIAILAALAAFAMAPSACLAETNRLFQPVAGTVMTDGFGNQCNSSGGGGVWQNWFVNTGQITNYAIIYDITNPPPTGSTGSMYQTQGWNGSGGGSLSTFICVDGNFWGGEKVDMTQFQSIEMDFRYDTNSTMTPVTSQGFNLGVNRDNVNSVGIFLRGIYNTGADATNFDGQWHHLSTAIPSNILNATTSEGPSIHIFNNAAVTGSFNYWLANVRLIARTNPVIILPPVISLEKTSPGLRQFADAVPSYNRNNLRTDTTAAGSKNIDWVGHAGAAYSWTVSEFPGAGHANFHMALTLTPDPAESITYSDPDWGSTNALWLEIQANANGSVRSQLSWKTNLPVGNNQYGPNALFAGLNVPNPVGTWTLSFPSDTSCTLTAPGGVSTNVTLPAAMFAVGYTNISLALYSGMNADANVGQFATFTSFSITGVDVPVNEDLTDGAINTPFLMLESQGYFGNPNPPNQYLLTSSAAYWLHWTLPDLNFYLVQKTNLTSPYWSDFAPGNILINGASRWVSVPAASLPSLDAAFFALQLRTNSQLQVILPGETAAPNTPTGKTGTPTNASLGNGGIVDPIIVNAVDANWNVITNVTDTIHLTSTDGAASVPADVIMTGGVATFSGFAFNTLAGPWTITATNISRVMPAATSAPVTVDP